MIRLDDGVEQDPHAEHVSFDYITHDILAAIDNYEGLDDYVAMSTSMSSWPRPNDLLLKLLFKLWK